MSDENDFNQDEVFDEPLDGLDDPFEEVGDSDPFSDIGEVGDNPIEQQIQEGMESDAAQEAEAEAESADEVIPDLAGAIIPDTKKKVSIYRRPRADVYTVLLFLALLSLSTAAVLHYQECTQYDYGFPSFDKNSKVVPRPVRENAPSSEAGLEAPVEGAPAPAAPATEAPVAGEVPVAEEAAPAAEEAAPATEEAPEAE